ncbi:MAG: DUF1501 domain-containing protein [Pirellulales bacterium]
MCNSVGVGCSSLFRMNRRQALGLSIAGGSGLWMTQFAEQLARAADDKSRRPKSLLILWCQGGPSQLDTFDPHPGTKIGGDVKSISTSAKGVEVASTMEATAQQMHRTCLVRSMISKEGDHERATYNVKTGWRPEPTVIHPSIGSVLCFASPSNLEIPRHISIISSQWPGRAGYLGPAYDAFKTGDPQFPIPNLTPRVEDEQFEKRVGILNSLETEFQRGRMAALDKNRTQHQSATTRATKMMSSKQLSAFDIKQESKSKQSAFGENEFGRGCLAAIRLLEVGVRCVEVEISGWDTHINNHELQAGRAAVLDKALAATLNELAERDMLNDTIVMCGGEFGRTPKINPAGGRDHWPHGFSMLLAGGAFRKGYVHGATNPNPDIEMLESGKTPDPEQLTEKSVNIADLHATVLTALGVNFKETRMTPIGRPLAWSDGEAIKELLEG